LLPWTRFLPEAARAELAVEFVQVTQAAAAVKTWLRSRSCWAEWRHTAEIYADPELFEVLSRHHEGDYGAVPEPGSVGMSPKRGDRAAPPPRPDEYDLRFANNDAAKGWDELCRQAAGNTRSAYEKIRTTPCPAAGQTNDSTASSTPSPLAFTTVEPWSSGSTR